MGQENDLGNDLRKIKPNGRKSGADNGYNDHTEWASLPSPEESNSDLDALMQTVDDRDRVPADPYETPGEEKEAVRKLSSAKLYELVSSPLSLPKPASLEDLSDASSHASNSASRRRERWTVSETPGRRIFMDDVGGGEDSARSINVAASPMCEEEESPFRLPKNSDRSTRPPSSTRTISSPLLKRRLSASRIRGMLKSNTPSTTTHQKLPPLPLPVDELRAIEDPNPSPMPKSIPVPPLSLHTYLQLEMSSQRPSSLYIHRSKTSDFPYESSRVKIERLLNFLLLPPQLEQVLWFGALACLDAWLYSFTILPLRFFKALSILGRSWSRNLAREAQYIGAFIYTGTGRMWRRRRRQESTRSSATQNSMEDSPPDKTLGNETTPTVFVEQGHDSEIDPHPELKYRPRNNPALRHRRTKSVPSALSPDHKADILKGFLIILSCTILMYFDASRMYHGIRGQAAIKLYVIYNVLEVCDRLFSALGQDVLECLFSKEALERKPDGHSKVWRPFWLFCLALGYNLVHSMALFYQVITLNVAVNSYSNALLTLLMSNQFVEIKSTVFKKFEKENLFQITCADVVERFQLWLMLMIIASRNIIETGGLSIGSSDGTGGEAASAASLGGPSMLPKSFIIFPEWTGQVMGPFFLVLGSEMLVDWIKHAYITKFNMTKPAIYGRFLDVLAKDYYSNAFADQNLTRRLGLPVIPLACLFIRASVQTYHMFLATHIPMPLPSTATSLSTENATSSPATTAALQHIDQIFRRALGRSTFGGGGPTLSPKGSSIWNVDDIIAFGTMLVFFLVLFLALLAFKLVLGMCLLSFARGRYKGMKERENTPVHAEGERVGGWGVIEVDDDKRRWIYRDDPEGARKLREKERAFKEQGRRPNKEDGEPFSGVSRYSMVSKRIW